MGVKRLRSADGLLNEYLARGVGNMVFAPYDMSNFHFKIVNNHREMEQRFFKTFSDDKIFELCCVKFNFSSYHIAERNFFIGIFESYDFASLSSLQSAGFF